MSYTAENQLLETPLTTAADALENLTAPIRERLKDSGEWKKEHLEELAALLQEVIAMEVKLRLLAKEVR